MGQNNTFQSEQLKKRIQSKTVFQRENIMMSTEYPGMKNNAPRWVTEKKIRQGNGSAQLEWENKEQKNAVKRQ